MNDLSDSITHGLKEARAYMTCEHRWEVLFVDDDKTVRRCKNCKARVTSFFNPPKLEI